MPNRILKESICTSDSLSSLSDFQENFFFRLIVNCDDYGRMDARPAILKARLYPLRERLALKDIQSALRALADVGCVEVYEVDGKPYLHLPSWEVHQQIRAKKSKFPGPDEAKPSGDSTCNHLISSDIKCPRNPIQSESESESESESNARGAFDAFWAAYPKKVGKGEARKAFQKVKVPVSALVEAVNRQKQSDQWRRDKGQYIPNPATWLNQGRWEDELPSGGLSCPAAPKSGADRLLDMIERGDFDE